MADALFHLFLLLSLSQFPFKKVHCIGHSIDAPDKHNMHVADETIPPEFHFFARNPLVDN